MSYQEPNQSPFGPPPQQQPGQSGWGQQSQPGTWGQPGAPVQEQQQSWGAQPGQQGWGSQQAQIPQQPNYPNAPGYGQPGQPQDFVPQQQQQFNQQPGFGQGPGYPAGPQGYLPQTDFGSGAGYVPGYPPPNQGNSTLATVSLWLGILTGFGLINLVISILAIKETGPGKKQGRNKAVIGLVLTLVWAVVWTGAAIALTNHAKHEVSSLSAAPTISAPAASSPAAGSTANTGSGSSGEGATSGATAAQAMNASDDPGCQAVKNAYNTFVGNPGTASADSTYISALQAAAAESQVASSQISTMAKDMQEVVQTGQLPSGYKADAAAVESACEITFSSTGAN